jgi:hypothetical protein
VADRAIDVPPGAASRPTLTVSLYERPVVTAPGAGPGGSRREQRDEMAR